MSGRNDHVMEDKYAKKAVSFKSEPLDIKDDFNNYSKMENLGSDAVK